MGISITLAVAMIGYAVHAENRISTALNDIEHMKDDLYVFGNQFMSRSEMQSRFDSIHRELDEIKRKL